MKIVVVLSEDLNSFPPVISLIKTLLDIGCSVKLICCNTKTIPEILCGIDNLTVIKLYCRLGRKWIKKTIRHFRYEHRIRTATIEAMQDADILWTATDNTVRDLGKLIHQYKHVMQLMELIREIPLAPGLPFFKFKIDLYARSAYKVVVPEYNRAHILKTWWQLDKLPDILPNKPYMDCNPNIILPENVEKEIQNLRKENRRIILYQGVFGKDRNIEIFAKAVEMLGDKYVLYLMGRENSTSKALCARFHKIKYIGFINPPNHLNITKYAYIGILSYVPKGKINNISELNPLYCAPNKLYEFSGFGIPMVGNDVPGLRFVFDRFGIGICAEELTPESIADCIRKVENNYTQISENCKKFFLNTDMELMVKNIIGMNDYK